MPAASPPTAVEYEVEVPADLETTVAALAAREGRSVEEMILVLLAYAVASRDRT